MRRPQLEIMRAHLRLRNEVTAPLKDVVMLAHVSEETLRRWATQGKRGVWLDAIHDRQSDEWRTSVEALERFLDDVERQEAGHANPSVAS